MSWNERKQHYTDVAKGTRPTKSDCKYSEIEQKAYARGVRDEMNRNSIILKRKNSLEGSLLLFKLCYRLYGRPFNNNAVRPEP